MQKKAFQIFPQQSVLDFDFNPQKSLLSILTPQANHMVRMKNDTDHQTTKLIKSTQHHRVTRPYFSDKVHFTQTNLKLFLHHSAYSTQNILHVDDTHFQAKNQIDSLSIDPYGLICFSSGSSIYLSKFANLYTKEFRSFLNRSNSNKIGTKRVHILNQLVHNAPRINSFSLKNSLLISGSSTGLISLWDINKAKNIHSSQYLKYPITKVGTYLNFRESNLYYANYGHSQNVIFCDIRTNRPIKILNRFNGEINAQVTKGGILIGTDAHGVDFVDVNRGFKAFRIQKQLLELNQKRKEGQKIKSPNQKLKLLQVPPPLNSRKLNINMSVDQVLQRSKKTQILTAKHSPRLLSRNNSHGQLHQKKYLSQQNLFKITPKPSAKKPHKIAKSSIREVIQKQQSKLLDTFICSSAFNQDRLFLGQNDGKVKIMNYGKIDLDVLGLMPSFKENLTQIDTREKSPIVKIVQSYTGAYILHQNGKLYQINQ